MPQMPFAIEIYNYLYEQRVLLKAFLSPKSNQSAMRGPFYAAGLVK